ncbi:MAG: hypothetical protein IT204_25305 [Fimbriimonadaceae bacterium]|nr:hypothetical protein [Fimbriimonadaceae bacterium]
MWLTLSLLLLTAPAPRGVVGDCPPALAAEVLQIEWPGTGPWWAPREVAGHTVVRYGDVLVIEPTVPVTLDNLLRDVPEPYQALLRRGEDGPETATPQAAAPLTEAATILVRGWRDEVSRQRLREAACWMAAPTVGNLWQQQVQRQAGEPWLRVAALPVVGEPLFGLLAAFPSTTANYERVQTVALEQRGLDRFARKQAELGGTLPAAEYRQGLLERTRATTELGRDARLSTAITLDQVGSAAELAAAWSAQCGTTLTVAADLPNRPLRLQATALPARQALVALARVAGATLRPAGDGYRLDPPRQVAALLVRNTPLRWWPATQFTVNEQYAAEDDLRAACYAALEATWEQRLRDGALRLRELPEATRQPLAALLEQAVAWGWANLPANLPNEQGGVALKCWYHPDEGSFELSAPGYSQWLGGATALRLRALVDPPAAAALQTADWGGGR